MENEGRSLAARSILDLVFRNLPAGFVARLWDGTQIPLGARQEPFTLVFRSPETFRRLVVHPNTLRFAEAFINGDLEIEGDVFAAVGLADRIEGLRLGVRERLKILTQLRKL